MKTGEEGQACLRSTSSCSSFCQDRTEFLTQLNSMEDWLYDEGEDQPKKVYVERLAELRKRGDPVVERQRETLDRPAAFEEFGQAIVHYEKILSAYDAGVSANGFNPLHHPRLIASQF